MFFPTVKVFDSDSIACDIDRFFDRTRPWAPGDYALSSPYRVTSNSDGCVISIDLPGVQKDNIDAQIEGNVLDVSGKRENKNFSYRRVIDKKYDASTVSAKYTDGVLSFSFRIFESEKPRKISIE